MSSFDTLIHSARVVDGTGNPWFYADVALRNDQIAAIAPTGTIPHENVATVIDASGLVVCPGFIDILSHSILPLMADGRCLSKIMQGVTTEIMGEGWCPAPQGGKTNIDFTKRPPWVDLIGDWMEEIPRWRRFSDWLEALTTHGVTSNVGSFFGGGTVRMHVMGMEMGMPSDEEMAAMKRLVAEAMEDGAMGLSEALIYPPSAYTETAELIEICKVVSKYNGLYITHLRSEADEFLEGLEEAVTIGQQADLPIEIYHLKAAGKRNWPKLADAFARIERARAEGIDITADIYPYAAMGTGLSAVLPPSVAAGGNFFDNLRDPQKVAEIRKETLHPSGGWEAIADLVGPENVMPVGLQKPENQHFVGKRLTEIADALKMDWFDAVVHLFLSEDQRIATIYYSMNEENVKRKLRQPWVTIGTDAGGMDPEWARRLGPVHPRGYGSYARILGRYVRDEKVIPLEDAIRKMSGAVAARLGIKGRGLLSEGYQADVVLFNPATIADHSTFSDPHHLSTGVEHVWINGTRVLKNGQHTGATPGRVVAPNR